MIKLTIINNDENHFLIQADEPIRIEVLQVGNTGKTLMYAYKGKRIDQEQEPSIVYDGTQDCSDMTVQ